MAVIDLTRPINCTWLKEIFLIVRKFPLTCCTSSIGPVNIARFGRFERSFPQALLGVYCLLNRISQNPVNCK